MSALLSTVSTGLPLLAASDGRHVADEYADDDEFQPAILIGLLFTQRDALGQFDYTNDWWPAAGDLFNTGGIADVFPLGPAIQRIYPVAGANGRFSVAGIARDQYGSAIPGATLRLFRVANDSLQAKVVADGNGAFLVTSPYNDAHFITVHSASTVAGATVDTVAPA